MKEPVSYLKKYREMNRLDKLSVFKVHDVVSTNNDQQSNHESLFHNKSSKPLIEQMRLSMNRHKYKDSSRKFVQADNLNPDDGGSGERGIVKK